METYLIYYEYFLKIIVYVYMWYLGHIIGKQQILICSKVVVKSNCTVYSVQWLNTWVTHTQHTHTGWHTDTLRLSLWQTSNKLISQYLIQDSTFGRSKYHWFTIFKEDIWSPVYCAMYMLRRQADLTVMLTLGVTILSLLGNRQHHSLHVVSCYGIYHCIAMIIVQLLS